MAVAMGVGLWSPTVHACGLGGGTGGLMVGVVPGLMVVLLLSVISLLSLRSASRAFRRMRGRRPGRGLALAHVASLVGYGISVVGTVVSGGLLLVALGLGLGL